MKTYDVVLYECSSCAYATQFAGNAARHAATIKCSGGSMSGKSHRLVKFEDVAPADTAVGRETITTVPGFECSACGYATGDRSNAAKHAKKCGAEIALAHLRVSVLSTRPRVAAPRFRMAERAKKEAAEKAAERAEKAAERAEKAVERAEKARKEAEEKARKEAEEKARKEAEEKARKEAERAEEKARKEAERAERAEEKARKEAERAEEKARKEAEMADEKARKEAERAEEKARKEAERAEEKARKEAEMADEKARKEAEEAEEKARKEAEEAEEKARKEAERAEEKARKEAERAERARKEAERAERARKEAERTSGGVAEEAPKLERPDANMRTDMMRAIPRLGARKMDITSIEDLPALLFRAARGTDAPARHLAVDGNTVLELGPRGGAEQTSIDKFVRRVLADAEGACGTCGGQDLRDEFEAKNIKGGRRGELHSRSDLIRMYSSGDHRYYRASCEGKDFVRKTADAVRDELDALRAGG